MALGSLFRVLECLKFLPHPKFSLKYLLSPCHFLNIARDIWINQLLLLINFIFSARLLPPFVLSFIFIIFVFPIN